MNLPLLTVAVESGHLAAQVGIGHVGQQLRVLVALLLDRRDSLIPVARLGRFAGLSPRSAVECSPSLQRLTSWGPMIVM